MNITSTPTNHLNDKHRLFLGIPISQNDYFFLKNTLFSHYPDLSDGKFIPDENAHLTIRFFGDISERKIAWLIEAIYEKIKNYFLPFSLNTDKIALFPNQQGKMIAAYCLNHPILNELFLRIHEISIDHDYHNEKTFIPHVTLYRFNDKNTIAFPEITAVNRALPVNQLVLYESQLLDEARIYQQIHVFNVTLRD